MAQPAIQIEGLDRLQRELRLVKDVELDAEMKAIHKGLADDILELALPNVPEVSGDLKRTVRAAGTKRDAIGRAGSAKGAPYAPIVHWKYGPQFLTDAAAEVERGVVDRYEDALSRLFTRAITP